MPGGQLCYFHIGRESFTNTTAPQLRGRQAFDGAGHCDHQEEDVAH